MKKSTYLLGIVFAITFLTSTSVMAMSTTLLSNGTKWIGINNIGVNGVTYNVSFFDGTYNQARSIYGDPVLDYSETFASNAALAIFDFFAVTSYSGQVFNGCTLAGTNNGCFLATSINLNSLIAYSWNTASASVGRYTSHQSPNIIYNNATNLIWEEVAVSTVPLPAAAWLFGSALLGVFGISRRKKRLV